jgi:hypothetical protein
MFFFHSGCQVTKRFSNVSSGPRSGLFWSPRPWCHMSYIHTYHTHTFSFVNLLMRFSNVFSGPRSGLLWIYTYIWHTYIQLFELANTVFTCFFRPAQWSPLKPTSRMSAVQSHSMRDSHDHVHYMGSMQSRGSYSDGRRAWTGVWSLNVACWIYIYIYIYIYIILLFICAMSKYNFRVCQGLSSVPMCVHVPSKCILVCEEWLL